MKERWPEMLEYQQEVQAMTKFRDLVRAMRAAQKEYFHCRERDVLIRSKQLEKQVDAALQEEEPASRLWTREEVIQILDAAHREGAATIKQRFLADLTWEGRHD